MKTASPISSCSTENFCFHVGDYSFGFNGKDKESEFNSGAYDFGARIHDARLGRFMCPDPDERKYPYQSTFVCAGNNPVQLIDLNGRGPDDPQNDTSSCEEEPDCIVPSTISDPAKLSFGYYGLDRTQIGGNTDLKLNLDFNYIQRNSGSRFSPDEPSSFFHADFTFGDNNENIDYSVGIFRNHTKGDFLLGEGNDVHFGFGNSQVGIGVGLDLSTPSVRGFTSSAALFVGIGPQFSNFTSGANTVSSSCWGLKGMGEVGVLSWNIINSPPLGGLVSFSWSLNATVHHAQFSDFDVTNANTGATTTYNDVNFVTGGISNTVSINFHFRGRK